MNMLKRWETLLLVLLVAVVAVNVSQSPFYLRLDNIINLFQLSIEKIIVALVMAFVIINGEIDLSVSAVMGLAACVVAVLHSRGVDTGIAVIVALLVGVACGAFNGLWIAYGRLPALAVTLAGLIGYRGIARILLEDKSIGQFPDWFNALGQLPLIGPFPIALIVFALMMVAAIVILQRTAFGRYVYVIGNNREVARYSGIDVRRVKMMIFIASSTIAALAGILLAARLGAVRGNTAEGFELDIITMVLLGGVSIFGGSGTLAGVALSILLILNLRNGMSLANITGNTQTGVIGALLILSVLVPNMLGALRGLRTRGRRAAMS